MQLLFVSIDLSKAGIVEEYAEFIGLQVHKSLNFESKLNMQLIAGLSDSERAKIGFRELMNMGGIKQYEFYQQLPESFAEAN